jgi:hypothetical protein
MGYGAEGAKPITRHQFLARWKSDHINSGIQTSDIPKLLEQLFANAETAGIDNLDLSPPSRELAKFINSCIREAIKEELR